MLGYTAGAMVDIYLWQILRLNDWFSLNFVHLFFATVTAIATYVYIRNCENTIMIKFKKSKLEKENL